ncbi:hypothetical protein ACTJKN_05210 [Pedobacter sp. 22163]|uniref:hypothetical protein n=1 Tax=Pedobacter sp. 22163 TaxID=3453883 RepID=UPI003F866803
MSSTEIAKGFKKLNPGPLDEWYGPYANTAAACAAIPNTEISGSKFRLGKVVGVITDSIIVDYAWKGGVLDADLQPVFKGLIDEETLAPIEKNINTLKQTVTQASDSPFEWSDELGNIVLQILADGGVEALKLLSKSIEIGGKTLIKTENEDYLLSYEDTSGNIAFGVTKDKTLVGVRLPDVSALGINSTIYHIIVGGQSLSIGAYGSPPITVNQKYNNIMFKGGVVTWFYGSSQESLSAFVDHTESPAYRDPDDDTADGFRRRETVASGIGEMFIQSLSEEENLEFEDDFRLMFTCTGESNQDIDKLSKYPSDPAYAFNYEKNITAISKAFELSKGLGLSYNVPAIVFIHGEADLQNNGDYYISKLKNLKRDFCADVRAITGQDNDPIMIISQVASHRVPDLYPNIALAQLKASLGSDGIYFGTTSYDTAYYADNIHKVNTAYKQMGASIGYALKRIVVNGDKWEALHGIAFRVQKDLVEIDYNVIKGKLEFDTTLVTEAADKGFAVYNLFGGKVPIESVTIKRLKTISIRLSGGVSFEKGWKITYGMTLESSTSGPIDGARGNLRDNLSEAMNVIYKGSTATGTDNFVYPLYRWAAIQEHTI